MFQDEYRWLVEQKNIMLDKIMLTAKRLQEARRQIAEPYVLALKNQFPNQDEYKLIRIADEDLQKSNEYYNQLTRKLSELQEFSQGPFQGLVEMIKQTPPQISLL